MQIDNGKIRITATEPQVRLPHEGRVDIAREISSAKGTSLWSPHLLYCWVLIPSCEPLSQVTFREPTLLQGNSSNTLL